MFPVWHDAFADVSISEEPGAVVPHAGIRAGAVGQLAVLPQWRLMKPDQMAMFNYLALNIICPRCGVQTEMEADFRFGLRDLTYYRIGDRLRWDGMGVRTPEARPEEGNYDDEAYVVCPHCERDFWLAVSIRQDIIVRAMVDPTKQPYIFDGNRQPQETNGPVQSKWEPRAHTEKMKKKHLTTCFCVFLD